MELTQELLLEMYRRMVRIREFKLALRDSSSAGKSDKHIAVRPMMNLTLTVHHHCMDGVQAARFLGEVRTQLEQPHLLL